MLGDAGVGMDRGVGAVALWGVVVERGVVGAEVVGVGRVDGAPPCLISMDFGARGVRADCPTRSRVLQQGLLPGAGELCGRKAGRGGCPGRLLCW